MTTSSQAKNSQTPKYTKLNPARETHAVRKTEQVDTQLDPRATNTAERSHPIHGGRHN
jgi:hypothetical protein